MKRGAVKIPDKCSECGHKEGVICKIADIEKDILSEKKGSNYYKKGQVIFYEGNHSNGLYCIYKGKVKISKLGEDGKEQIVRFAKENDILGYRSMLSKEPYHGTATAMEDCYVCMVSKDRFNQVLEQDAKLSMNVIQLLSKDLRNAEQLLIDVAQKSVKERIAESIIKLERTFGLKEDGKTLDVILTRSELADMAATTTETAIRTLAPLTEEALISLNGKAILIENKSQLINIAGIYD